MKHDEVETLLKNVVSVVIIIDRDSNDYNTVRLFDHEVTTKTMSSLAHHLARQYGIGEKIRVVHLNEIKDVIYQRIVRHIVNTPQDGMIC